ncbi:MAG TPA: phosphatase PAP2 family protein [Steroidobacteraceae bacterium]
MSQPARRQWRAGWGEALCLLAIALLTAAVFAGGTLDIAIARAFYRPAPADHWPLAHELPWSLLYYAAPAVTATVVVTALAALAASFAGAYRDWRCAAVMVLLGTTIGPGLLANAVFKDHWQHPRPRELIEFGGPLQYVPTPLIGNEGGASFPCGHCSVGFMCAAGWWIWKRRRPAWAVASLAGGVTLGTLLGVGRMAAGAHFFSDILWSARLAFGVLHVLAYHVLHLPAREGAAVGGGHPDSGTTTLGEGWQRLGTLAAVLAGAGVLIVLFAAPHGTALAACVALTRDSPRVLEVTADVANVTVLLLDAPANELVIDGELHGFGLPGSRLAAHLEKSTQPPLALRYRIDSRGWLTDLDGMAILRVPAAAFDSVIIVVGRGNIRVSDLTRARVAAAGSIRLELHTARGHVQPAG